MKVVVAKCGISLNRNLYTPQVLRAAVEKFNGARVYDAFPPGPTGGAYPVDRIVGAVSAARFDEATLSVVADLAFYAKDGAARFGVEDGSRLWLDAAGKGEVVKGEHGNEEPFLLVEEITRVDALALKRERL